MDDVWVGEGVVFGDVDEFDGVGAAMLIRCVCSGGFVAVPVTEWNWIGLIGGGCLVWGWLCGLVCMIK